MKRRQKGHKRGRTTHRDLSEDSFDRKARKAKARSQRKPRHEYFDSE